MSYKSIKSRVASDSDNVAGMPDEDIEMLRRDVCPDCLSSDGFTSGPRGGASQDIFCTACGEGFNICFPRMIIWGQRIGKRRS